MAARPGALILVVDDDIDLAETICDALRLRGYAAVACASAGEAIAQLEARVFELLLSDISMPGMSGYDLLKQVRDRWPSLPSILMTAMQGGLPPSRGDMMATVLHKPLSFDELVAAIEAALER